VAVDRKHVIAEAIVDVVARDRVEQVGEVAAQDLDVAAGELAGDDRDPIAVGVDHGLVVPAGLQQRVEPVAGAVSMALYLAAGAAGLPVFTPIGAPGVARFFGPTGGYLIAYPAAAYVAGALTQRSLSFAGRWLAGVAGIAIIYIGGIAQLFLLSGGIVRAVQLGVIPFAAVDVVKAFIAAAITAPRMARRDS